MRTIVLVVMVLMATNACASRGAFIAFHETNPEWSEAFEAMRAAGMNVAILQYTAVDAYDYDTETDEFIEAAETAEMPYYLGLHYHGTWDQLSESEMSTRISKNIRLLTEQLPPKVKGRRFFRGWYMPLEVGNDRENMHDAARLVTIAKKTSDPIAMSAYFDPEDEPPAAFATAIRDAIAPYAFVLLQDSVIVGGATEDDLKRYYAAIDAVKKQPVWVVVEAFHRTNIRCETFAEQVRRALARTPNVVVFEWKELSENPELLKGWLAGTGQQPCPN